MQVKITIRDHFTPKRWVKIKHSYKTKLMGILFTGGGNKIWNIYIGAQFDEI